MSDARQADTTYASHSREPELVEANRAFLARQPMDGVSRFLDLACGTGAISEMLLDARPGAHLNGIDSDPAHIDLCVARFAELGYPALRGFDLTSQATDGKPAVTFGVGSADDLPFPAATFECVTIANAIHLLPDKERLVAAVARVLKPGGAFGFNSAFYVGTFPEGTHTFYTEWLKAATIYMNDLSKRLQAEGKPGIKRVRGKGHKALQNRWLPIEEWRDLLGRQGLEVRDVNERVVMLDGHFFSTIGAYGGLAETLMSGFPVDIACEALETTAQPTLDSLGRTAIPRNWLEVWATKS